MKLVRVFLSRQGNRMPEGYRKARFSVMLFWMYFQRERWKAYSKAQQKNFKPECLLKTELRSLS